MDKILIDFVNRSMKQIITNHAQDRGAPDEWIKSLDNLSSMTLYHVVSICYGEPECFKKMDRRVIPNIHP